MSTPHGYFHTVGKIYEFLVHLAVVLGGMISLFWLAGSLFLFKNPTCRSTFFRCWGTFWSMSMQTYKLCLLPFSENLHDWKQKQIVGGK